MDCSLNITVHPYAPDQLDTPAIVELRSHAPRDSRTNPASQAAHQTALSPQDGVWMSWMFHGYLEPSIDTSPQSSGSRPITRHCGPLEGCGQTACQKRLQKSIARRTD